jgi:hypothetical protein
MSKYDRVSAKQGKRRYGSVVKVDNGKRRALVQWDGESVTQWYLVTKLSLC